MTAKTDAAGIVDRLEQEYRKTVEALRSALKDFIAGGPPPDPALRAAGAFSYPELRLYWPAGCRSRGSAAPMPASASPATTP
jgi:AMP nucleosidase